MTRSTRVALWATGVLGAAFVLIAVAQGVLRIVHSDWVFAFSEGPVLASIHTFANSRSLSDLYPAGQWAGDPPLLLTLYSPIYLVISGVLVHLTGTSQTFLTARVLSLGALIIALALPIRIALRRGLDWRLVILVVGALVTTPGIRNLTAAAQVDVLALMWAGLGIMVLVPDRTDEGSPGRAALVAAGLFFWLAFFTKQNFVAAPLAVFVYTFSRNRFRALAFAAGLSAAVLIGLVWLNSVTGGGYFANTVRALLGASDIRNVTAILRASAPLQWVGWVGLLALLAARKLRWGVPELYAGAVWLLHLASMLKTGASVNYLLEPLFATFLLAACRAPAGPPATATLVSRTKPALGLVVAWVAVATMPLAYDSASEAAVMVRQDLGYSVQADSDSPPLLDVYYFPAILAHGVRPYLNDPFAFGTLYQAGQWTAEGLVTDLRGQRIPYVMTTTDLSVGPASPGLFTEELGHGYFWRIPAIWQAITAAYEPVTITAPYIWTPRDPLGVAEDALGASGDI